MKSKHDKGIKTGIPALADEVTGITESDNQAEIHIPQIRIRKQQTASYTQSNCQPLQPVQFFMQNKKGEQGREDRTNHISQRSRFNTDMVHNINKRKPVPG